MTQTHGARWTLYRSANITSLSYNTYTVHKIKVHFEAALLAFSRPLTEPQLFLIISQVVR